MLAEILHQIAGQFENQEERKYYPRPSLAGAERCIRQLVYWGMNVQGEQLPGRTLHVFNDGSWHEELSADWIRKSAYNLHSEQMELDCFRVNGRVSKGHIDGIITDILGVDRLYEHKSINHFGFNRYWNNGALPIDYITQCCLYCNALQSINPAITEIILLIKNKNTSQFLEYLIEYHPDVAMVKDCINSIGEKKEINQMIYFPVTYAIDKFKRIDQYINSNELPPRQYEMTDWQCQYCRFSETCYEGYESEFEKLESDVALENDFIDLCHYYLECSMHETEIKKEKDALKTKIKEMLKEKNVKDGTVGDYLLKLSLRSYTKVVNMNLVPKENTQTTHSETLTIRKRKEKKGGKNE